MKKLLAFFILLSMFFGTALLAAEVPRMNKDDLKEMLGSDNLVILDVRTGMDWSNSNQMIRDAVRVDGRDLSVAENYPKDSTFVLYCS